MSQLTDDAAEFLAFEDKFRAFFAVAKSLKSVGDLDSAVAERAAALDKATEELLAKNAELTKVNAAIDAARDTIINEAAANEASLAKLLDDAQMKAAKIIADAQWNAQQAKDSAAAEISSIQAAHKAAIATLQGEIGATQDKLDSLRADLADAAAAKASTEAAVASLRQQAQKVLAG